MPLDISEVLALTREAVRSLETAQPKEVKRILDRAAADERRTHAYRNRTGWLEKSTFAADLDAPTDGWSFELGARMHYASYVDNRGLMRIDEKAAKAATEIEYYLDGEAERLGSK